MTPTDSAEKVVADHERIWPQNAVDGEASGEGRMWCQDKVWLVDENDGEPTEYVRADIHAAALALIESQRATIERVERERDEALARRWPQFAKEQADRALAAEARVTALEAEKAGDHAILRDLVASLNRRGQTLSISHDELSALEARASQALSRSSTEVKNDEA